jgi:DNA-binding MarR family transcriptional regulator
MINSVSRTKCVLFNKKPVGEGEIKLLLFLLVKFLKQTTEQRLKKAGVEIGMLGLGILHLLNKQELTIGALSQRLILKPATLVPVVNSLAQKGLLKKYPGQTDRRSHRLLLTPKGRKLLNNLPAGIWQDPLAKSLKSLDPNQLQNLRQLLIDLNQTIIGTKKFKSILNLCLNH